MPEIAPRSDTATLPTPELPSEDFLDRIRKRGGVIAAVALMSVQVAADSAPPETPAPIMAQQLPQGERTPQTPFDPLSYVREIAAHSDYNEVLAKYALATRQQPTTDQNAYRIQQDTVNEIAVRHGVQLTDSTTMRQEVDMLNNDPNSSFSQLEEVTQEYFNQIGVTLRFANHAREDEQNFAIPSSDQLEGIEMRGRMRELAHSAFAYMPKTLIDFVTGGKGLEIILTTPNEKYAGLALVGGDNNRIVFAQTSQGVVEHEFGHLTDFKLGYFSQDPGFTAMNDWHAYGDVQNPKYTQRVYSDKRQRLTEKLFGIYKAEGYEACERQEEVDSATERLLAQGVFFSSDYAGTGLPEDKAETYINVFRNYADTGGLPVLNNKSLELTARIATVLPHVGAYYANLRQPPLDPFPNTCENIRDNRFK